MAERGLEDYASPILRASVFRRLYPGAQISYSVIAIEEAFPMGHRDYEGKALEAVRCEIIFADGTFIVAHKEIDLKERNRDVAQTPEQLAKDETKCLGRALRDAGIPQRLSELKLLMQWYPNVSRETSAYISSPGRPPNDGVGVAQETIETIFPGSVEETDATDAGADDPTPAQILAKRFAFLEGPAKAKVVAYARETLGVSNVLQAGEHAEAIMLFLDVHDAGETVAVAAPPNGVTDEMREAALATTKRGEERRQKEIEDLGPEEPFLSLGIQHVEGYRNQTAP